MHLILLSSLLLLGTSLVNGHDTDPEGQLLNSLAETVDKLEKKTDEMEKAFLTVHRVLNSLAETVDKLEKKTDEVQKAFLTVHRARSFGSGSERLYVTNKQIRKFEALGNICAQASGRIPSPQLQNEAKAFASVLERHNKTAYLVVHDSASFTNWAAGEPNNANGTKVCVIADTQGAWHSESCEEDHLVVCEFSFI